jgi:3-methyladenine DNA glycosylase AlkD
VTSAEEVLERLRAAESPRDRAGMARFGINTDRALGISVTALRRMAGELGRDHRLAAGLWRSGIHEARILAALVDEPEKVTEAQMERWARAFDSWDLCDQVCANLFDRTPFAHAKVLAWSERPEEFVKRAGFALMAALAVHDRGADDDAFRAFLPAIEREATDGRNFVRKAVNWALRQIGKRNRELHREAVRVARRLAASEDGAARWVGRDAVRELKSERTRARLG